MIRIDSNGDVFALVDGEFVEVDIDEELEESIKHLKPGLYDENLDPMRKH